LTQSEPVAVELLQTQPPVQVPGSLGQRLCASRQAHGWSCEDAASRLRLPVQIVQTLESDHYDRIGHAIYLRGYLTSYLRLLGMPTILVEAAVREHDQAEPLIASGKISHSRYLFQRYSVSALYLILTGVIIVPAVLLAMRANFEPNLAQFAPLDTPATNAANSLPISTTTTPSSAIADNPAVVTKLPASSAAAQDAPSDAPLIASMAPFSLASRTDDARHEPMPATTTAGSHTLTLKLSEPSWVQIVAANGEKLEYGLLPAGTQRTYNSDQSLDVRLGNSNGAQVVVGGQAQDLAPYRHANVAHFKLFTAGQPISHTDS